MSMPEQFPDHSTAARSEAFEYLRTLATDPNSDPRIGIAFDAWAEAAKTLVSLNTLLIEGTEIAKRGLGKR